MKTGEDLCLLFGIFQDETIGGSESQVSRLNQRTVDASTDTNLGKEMQIEMQRLFDLVHVAGTTSGQQSMAYRPLPAEESCNTALELFLAA